ncbi:MAG: hypothetical protein DI585_05315 [Pseudomonas fluorescens]|nr:MAG: hypothetical protein DI585_05315 [Pseudomonas fluorescens]
MLSYQHAFHIGGPADVIKHTLWAHVLAHLARKEGALHVYETHSGRGLYPTAAPETQKTPEYRTGTARLMASQPENLYLDAVKALNPDGKLTLIPGSPAVARHVLRPEDHLNLAEAHPAELEHLRVSFPHAARREGNIHIHEGDGHKLIPSMVRAGQRTAVLIDPSFEVKSEYLQTVETVEAILTRNPRATVMVWYPLLQSKKNSQALIEGLKALNVPATYLVHYGWNTPDSEGMHGTGQIILNLPYKMESDIPSLLKPLSPLLKQGTAQLTTTLLVPRT